MGIENRSAYHPTSKLLPLVEFVCKRTKFHRKAHIAFYDGGAHVVSGGYSWKERPDERPPRSPPSLVNITLSRTRHYPAKESFLDDVPAVVLNSWDEEVLLVLAHELRHIDQYWRSNKITDEHEAEVDAERFAVQVLNEYQLAKQDVSAYTQSYGALDVSRHGKRAGASV